MIYCLYCGYVSAMARKPSMEFEGTLYDVIVGSNQRQKTFQDDHDRRACLERIEYYQQRYGFRVYGRGQV